MKTFVLAVALLLCLFASESFARGSCFRPFAGSRVQRMESGGWYLWKNLGIRNLRASGWYFGKNVRRPGRFVNAVRPRIIFR